jgi:hypothetical protein
MEQQASLAARAPEGSSTIKVMVTKTGKIYRVEHLDEAKQLWTVWAAGATQIMVWADKHSAAELAASNNPDSPNPFMTDFSVTDFPGFGWVGWDKFSEIKTYRGMKCIVFQEQQPVAADAPSAGHKTVTAYVDVDSRLPVGLLDGNQANVFEWRPTPRGVLTLPPSALAVLQQRQKAQQQMSEQAARPY